MHNRSVSYPDLQINGNTIERVTGFKLLSYILYNLLSIYRIDKLYAVID